MRNTGTERISKWFVEDKPASKYRTGICTWTVWSFSQEVDYPSRNIKILSPVLENLLDLNMSLSFFKNALVDLDFG